MYVNKYFTGPQNEGGDSGGMAGGHSAIYIYKINVFLFFTSSLFDKIKNKKSPQAFFSLINEQLIEHEFNSTGSFLWLDLHPLLVITIYTSIYINGFGYSIS